MERKDCSYLETDSIPNLRVHRKVGAVHSTRDVGLLEEGGTDDGWGSEEQVEPAGQGLAGGASLRAWLLKSPSQPGIPGPPWAGQPLAGFTGLSSALKGELSGATDRGMGTRGALPSCPQKKGLLPHPV